MRPFGVYVHIPFCARRCDYCAFATWTDRHHLTDRYVAGLITEIRRAVDRGELDAVTSVFVGGGTPSMLPAVDLGRVLDAVPTVTGAEVTVECNPDTVSRDLLAVYREHGVNRISLGVQSMVPHVLGALGRTHDPDNVRRSVELLRDLGYPTFNLDLIYGGAGETLADWETTLRAAAELDPPHVSAYALTVEAGTPLALDTARHPDDDDQADKYALADDVLGEGGRTWYEISNWARPGHECRHNVLYWEQGDYLGFGCAAHSHLAGRRFWNVRTPERYLHLVEGGEPAEGGAEELDLEERRLEALTLAVRMRGGVPVEALGALDDLADLLDVRDGRAVLTRAGRLLANEVSLRLR
ncbi:MAG: radical SAM family heme chaperone HemW [Acidimicrobiia bacterium]